MNLPTVAIPTDPLEIQQRLRARLSRQELVALAVAVTLIFIFLRFQPPGDSLGFDFNNYLNAVKGDASFYFYAYWFLPVVALFNQIGFPANYIIWNLLNIAGIFAAARVFRGSPTAALLSFQLLYLLYLGQITGILIGGLALGWWGLTARRWHVAGLGIILACTKYQFGIPAVLALLYLSNLSWREYYRAFIVPALIAAASLLVYPNWPLTVLATIQGNPPNDFGSISLWRWFGPSVLVLWLPPLLLPLTRQKRTLAFFATFSLTLPYLQQTEILLLQVLPIGWIALLGNIGFLYFGLLWKIMPFLAILPLTLYVALLLPAAHAWFTARRSVCSTQPR